MDRNLNRRVEVAVPITDRTFKNRILHESFDLALEDNMNAWVLDSDGHYNRLHSGTQPPRHLQSELIEKLTH